MSRADLDPGLRANQLGYTLDDVPLGEKSYADGIFPVIPPKADLKTPVARDFRTCRDRNRIERMFNHPNSPPHHHALR